VRAYLNSFLFTGFYFKSPKKEENSQPIRERRNLWRSRCERTERLPGEARSATGSVVGAQQASLTLAPSCVRWAVWVGRAEGKQPTAHKG